VPRNGDKVLRTFTNRVFEESKHPAVGSAFEQRTPLSKKQRIKCVRGSGLFVTAFFQSSFAIIDIDVKDVVLRCKPSEPIVRQSLLAFFL
jgi:hypothetical protein